VATKLGALSKTGGGLKPPLIVGDSACVTMNFVRTLSVTHGFVSCDSGTIRFKYDMMSMRAGVVLAAVS